MARKIRPDIAAAGDAHERILRPLAGKGTNLEIALAYLRQVLKRMPSCEWQLGRAIAEIEDARQAIKETQTRAVEHWRNNYH